MHPFSDGDFSPTFRNLIDRITEEIHSLDNEYVLKASPTELEQHYIEKVMIDPLVLNVEERYIKGQTGVQIDVSHDIRRGIFPGERAAITGTRLDIAIPFEGDPGLWRLRASRFSLSGYPDIDIRGNEVIFGVCFPDDSADQESIQSKIERETNSLVGGVGHLKTDVDNHNNSAPGAIRQALARKRQLAQSVVGAVAALGIPMKRSETQPTFNIPAKRRQTPIKRPTVATGKYEPEPALDEEEYKHILEILRSMALVIERNPSSFASLNEEAIRDHFLLQLNGHYEGGATGETFNAEGKTDILIRADNRNVFIGECKFWHGPASFNQAIDQLLGYLTWRDSKCALLIFNKTKDSDAVRMKSHEVMETRPEHRRTVLRNESGDSRYVLVKDSDPGREITVTIQVYDVPKG